MRRPPSSYRWHKAHYACSDYACVLNLIAVKSLAPCDRYHKAHTHHAIYSDVDDVKVMDLKVFGQGHMLYFYFLKVR